MMIIDTNVYTALDKGIKSSIDILSNQSALLMPFGVIGELNYGFNFGTNTKQNRQKLERFLSQDFVEIILPTEKTSSIYGELASYCRRHGKALSNNDLWIASLSVENKELLATYDKDFYVLKDYIKDRLIILDY